MKFCIASYLSNAARPAQEFAGDTHEITPTKTRLQTS